MSHPSRPSLSGLSHRPITIEPPPSPERVITTRLGVLGVGLGFLFSCLTLIPAGQTESNRLATTVLSVVFSCALISLFLICVGTTVWAGVDALRRVTGRRSTRLTELGAGICCGLIVILYALLRGASELFRLNTGESLGVGSCEFVVGGIEQLAVPLLNEYRSIACFLGLCAGACGALTFFFVARPIAHGVSVFKLLGRAGISFATLALLVFVLTSRQHTDQPTLAMTADLSLLSSFGERRRDEQRISDVHARMGAVAQRGPLRQVAGAFDEVARRRSTHGPNVVLIMLESVGINHLGFMGYQRETTPHLDAISKQSLSFSSARTTATHSNYAQMAVLSSLFPRRYSGLDRYRHLDYPRVLWHDLLFQIGYETATYSSQDERWQGMLRFEQTRSQHVINHAHNYAGAKQVMGSERTIPDEVTARRAVDWISKQKVPFGLYVNFQSTHFPYVTPKSFRKRYLPDRPATGDFHYLSYPKSDRGQAINRYDNALAYVDAQVGYLIQSLDDMGILESTIVIVTSDHGELFGEHEMVTHGRSLFEEEARVPFLIRYPRSLPPGVDERAVSTLDVLPTLCGLLDLPPHPSFQGVDVLASNYEARRPLFLNIQGMRSREGVICHDYKYTRDPNGSKQALFDIKNDPHERHNLLEVDRTRAQSLDNFLTGHMSAQLAYHQPDEPHERSQRFAPRFGVCPD